MPNLAKTHGDKLNALLSNSKLPDTDKENVQKAIILYNSWREKILNTMGTESEKIEKCVSYLNDYMNFIEYDLIFKSTEDFLYRQKGQLKLDNTVMEEFLTLFVYNIFSSQVEKMKLSLGAAT